MKNVFIKRHIYSKLKAHLKKKEISLLIGPRQAGKTTLLEKLKDFLEKKGEQVFFFNLDILSQKEFFENQKGFIRYLENKRKKRKAFVFIDEVQRLENPGIFLKGIYDQKLPYKLIASGSSALEIKSKISESLTGRKRVFHLGTLSFEEFIKYKNPDLQSISHLKKTYSAEILDLLDEYCKFGGYPKVVVEKNIDEKIRTLEEIYSSYLEKDIKGFFQVRNETSFLTLVNLLAGQIGNLINKNVLSASIGSSRATVDNFLNYLEKSFVIKIIRPFFRNPKKELLKSAKVYFCDLGLRNLIIKNFNQFERRPDKGKIFENFVLLKLMNEIDLVDKINHWRTKTKAEVDFVITRGLEIIPLEVKAKNLKYPVYSKSFRSFLQKYSPKKGIILNLGQKRQEKLGSTLVLTKPFFEKILLDY